jgi:pheromone shutdown protein TraB
MVSPPDFPDDPRLSPETIRQRGRVTLVGVVHDHPASVHRARVVAAALDPDVLALELPPLAVPLHERHADADASPPERGGEMSAAVQAAPDAEVVGVDGPDRRFCRVLAGRLRDDPPDRETARRLASGLGSVTWHALACRVAAALGRPGPDRRRDGDYDCTRDDPPEVQAADERSHRRRSAAFARVVEQPRPVRVRDETREESMAGHLAGLADEGWVVAVVGQAHLDPVADRLGE